MATRELTPESRPAPSLVAPSVTPNYSRPLAVVTTLFFMWGFLTCLNDILVPHLKSIFDLSYARVMLIQFVFLPAASSASYPLFLTALLILAAGITGLQVAANPYVTLLGKPETASSR